MECICLHRVLLLQSDKHTEQLVVKAITTAIPGTSQDHALNCYNTAEKLGQAMITSCIKGKAAKAAQPQLCQVAIVGDSSHVKRGGIMMFWGISADICNSFRACCC